MLAIPSGSCESPIEPRRDAPQLNAPEAYITFKSEVFRDDGEAPYRELELPATTLLLSRARSRRFPPLGVEAWLCQAFEVERRGRGIAIRVGDRLDQLQRLGVRAQR